MILFEKREKLRYTYGNSSWEEIVLDQSTANSALLTEILDLGEQMLLRGAEVGRVEDTITRILRAQGASRVDVFTITSSIVVTAHWPEGPVTQTRRISGIQYDMTALTRLNALSRDICSGRCAPDSIRRKLDEIAHGETYGFPLTVLFYGLTSLVFSLFFGGSLLDGMISAGVGMLLRLMLRVLDRLQVPGVASTLLCAVIGGFFAHGLSHLGVPCAPDKVAIGNIMLLVPGIAMTNAIRDMFTGDTISGLLRFCESLLLSLALAWGFALPSALFL